MENGNKEELYVEIINDKDVDEVSKLSDGSRKEYFRIGPKGYFVPHDYKIVANEIYNMKINKEDVFIDTYQRSGTTMAQELVWLLANDLDYEAAAASPLRSRYLFLEGLTLMDTDGREYLKKINNYSTEVNSAVAGWAQSVPAMLASMSSPKLVKTHVPLSLLPPTLVDTAKVLYVARDPRDVMVSSYHHAKLLLYKQFKGDFKHFWNLFLKDLFIFTPYFDHVKDAWNKRHHENMLFLFYEDILNNMAESVERVAAFLGKEVTPEQVRRLCDHLHIDNFKKNKSVNYEDLRNIQFFASDESFVRKGKAGGWREYFDEEMTQQTRRWIMDQLRGTDLRFPSMEDINDYL